MAFSRASVTARPSVSTSLIATFAPERAELDGQRLADARPGSRDDGDLTGEALHGTLLFSTRVELTDRLADTAGSGWRGLRAGLDRCAQLQVHAVGIAERQDRDAEVPEFLDLTVLDAVRPPVWLPPNASRRWRPRRSPRGRGRRGCESKRRTPRRRDAARSGCRWSGTPRRRTAASGRHAPRGPRRRQVTPSATSKPRRPGQNCRDRSMSVTVMRRSVQTCRLDESPWMLRYPAPRSGATPSRAC